jgi:hypothetical protein
MVLAASGDDGPGICSRFRRDAGAKPGNRVK